MFYPPQIAIALSKSVINTWFDQVFYDVCCVTDAEQKLLPPLGPQPLLFCVPPTGRGELTCHQSVADLKASPNRPRVFALAGAVSASLGGVAFARNLADALEQPVCVILPGTAPGGWADQWGFFPNWSTALEKGPNDAEVLLQIVRDPEFEVTHLAGHSKGCLGLSEALLELERCGWRDGFKPAVLTLGGVVPLPARVGPTHQLLGDFDWLGSLNSRLDLDHQRVPGSGHHLNRQLPFHLDVGQVVRDLALPA